MDKIALKEAVVVEGRDDEAAVLRAVDAAVLSTHGWGMPEEALERIRRAAPEAIRDALLAARAEIRKAAAEDPVTAADLIALGLAGAPGSDALRQAVGRDLGIGSCNAKAFCRRLSASGITREELLAAWRRISQENR